MASQPVSGDQYVTIGTIGTTIVSDSAATLKRVIVGGTYVGSVYFYDSATIAGTAATNLVFTAAIPGAHLQNTMELNARFRNGIIATALGTPILTFTWDK
jgi:putative Mn2+ efflux pump MntP